MDLKLTWEPPSASSVAWTRLSTACQHDLLAAVAATTSPLAGLIERRHRIDQLVAGQGQNRLVDHHHGDFGPFDRVAIGVRQLHIDDRRPARCQFRRLRVELDRQRAADRRDGAVGAAGGVSGSVGSAGNRLALVIDARRCAVEIDLTRGWGCARPRWACAA